MTVRRNAAEAYLTARNAQPEQATLFKAELQKKQRNMPLRRLVRRTGDIITALCPCWMASPLSVSQLIDGRRLFDVVIFDEASQVLPWDAIPAIMRGKQTIVAGDQKQLPPTLFFASGSTDPEDDEADEDELELMRASIDGMESILDVMITFCNRQYLNVHYRSQDESLIRFSNHEFYQDRLVTFPGTGIVGGGISHILVEAKRIDGEELSSSTEIDRVVDLIFEHADQHPKESLGVISLGIKHARRLEAAIQERRKLRNDLDWFFAKDDVNRAFFVKNLERVQGDERDAIILSLGYGKDRTGRLLNRLGPINSSGGERRLNVAFTRSKTRMTVVSTFTEEDMDASRFSSVGARILCRFIEYARSDGARLSGITHTDVEVNGFERDIMDTLSARGLRIVPQLGVSQYRLDLAVLHPDIPNRYVLAIECDGAPYHSSATARDRDRLRQQHLEGMGWRFHRIWSMDWHEERAIEIERALKAYQDALSSSSSTPQAKISRNVHFQVPKPDANGHRKRGPKPALRRYDNITDYSDTALERLCEWIASDGVLRSDEEIIAEAVPNLGFSRRGRLIDERLRQVLRAWQQKGSNS